MHLRGLILPIAVALLLSQPAVSHATNLPFTLHWTAPGDDSLAGKATSYDLRYSSNPITSTNFSSALKIPGLPVPKAAGSAESFTVTVLPAGIKYYLAMRSVDDAGNWSKMSNVITHTGVIATGVDDSLSVNANVTLSFSEPRPNPAKSVATWAFALPRASDVQVDVYDVGGRLVQNLATGVRAPGNGEISWDLRDHSGRQVDAGVYFVKARFDQIYWTKRLLVVK